MSRENLNNLKCDYCGKFIGLDEFDDGLARRKLIIPDSDYSVEEYETYHISCHEASLKKEIIIYG